MIQPIQFIYFDMGKVLLEFDHDRMARQVADAGDVPIAQVESLLLDGESNLEIDIETGTIDEATFHQKFCDATGSKIGFDELMLACADIFWLNTRIVPVLKRLRTANFPMAILSNTSPTHWEFVRKRFAIIDGLFDFAVLSFEAGSMKPDAKIYEVAIEQAGCEPGAIFFTDDKPENVAAAREAGMQAEVFNGAFELEQELQRRNVPF